MIFLLIELKHFSARFGPLGLRNCNKKFCVCRLRLMSECKIRRRPSGHSFGPIYMKFDIPVYLCDA